MPLCSGCSSRGGRSVGLADKRGEWNAQVNRGGHGCYGRFAGSTSKRPKSRDTNWLACHYFSGLFQHLG